MMAPALHPWVRDDVARLTRAGVPPTLAEVVWLAELCRAAHTPPGRESWVDTSAPLRFAGVSFWPLHMLAQGWFVRWFAAFEGQPDMQAGVYLFAHTRSKPGDTSLRDLGDMDAVAVAVGDWMRELPVPEADLPELTERLRRMGASDEVPPPPKQSAAGAAGDDAAGATPEERAAMLCAQFQGTTPEYWLTGCSERAAMMMAAARIAGENADGCWANSPERARRMASYMNAVKWVARRGMGLDEKAG